MSGQFFAYTAAVLVALVAEAVDGQTLEDQLDMEDEKLARTGAGIGHRYGCAHSEEWKAGCDIDEKGNVLHRADWSFHCDPWSQGVWANSTTNPGVTHSHGSWTCPPEHRNPSGCGDFRDDPRSMYCDHPLSLDHDSKCFERVLIEVGEPLLPQKHVCVQHPIFFDNYNTAGSVTPPIVGRHREHWPKWGEYEYIPPQRWVHAMEHGGVIFLYNQCLDEKSLCSIRTFIKKWQLKMERGELDGGKFRFILTPSKNLQRNFAMVTWGEVYLSKCFNENEMDIFINLHYRRAWEDFDKDGKYDYLWVGLKNNTNCSLNVACAKNLLRKSETDDLKAASEDIASVAEIRQLRREQQTLRVLTVGACGLSLLSLFILVAILCRTRVMKPSRNAYLENASEESDA